MGAGIGTSSSLTGRSASGIRLARGWAVIGAIIAAALVTGAAIAGSIPIASALAVAVLTPAALIDLRDGRLPDDLVITAGVAFVVTALPAMASADVSTTDVLLGAAAMAVPLLAVHLISPLAMGFGDVKAAVVLGAAAGAVTWELALVALCLAAGVTATVGIMCGRERVVFGPGLVAGTAVILATHPVLGQVA
jgi:leader peptidase (prepilin peptidase)/N-methyltransferase